MRRLAIAVLSSSFFLFGQTKDGHHAEHGKGHGDHMEHRFEDPEKWAKNFDDPKRDAWQMPDRVIAALELKPGQAVADVGAGTGYFSVRLARSAAGPRVFAVDIEESMVKYLGERAAKEGLSKMVAVKASADSPNLPEKVDLVMVVDTYHHIGSRENYFRKLRGSLKPGGRLVIIDWKPGGPMGPPEHFRFSPEKIAGELKKAGYTQASRHDFLPNQNFLVFRAK